MSTYIGLASRFPDFILLDIIGDENPGTRKMMVELKAGCCLSCKGLRPGCRQQSVKGYT